ncbi:MAG: GGDEF domain-containing protein [Phycisphaerae bacterium]|jgi:GGDEF domain-containing protein|nr:GGDEF domain-containing protein [Phycisphaerae bacterium]
MPNPDAWAANLPFLIGAVALIAALGVGALLLTRRRATPTSTPVLTLPPVAPPPTEPLPTPPATAPGPAHRVCAAFHRWLAENGDNPEAWAAFDQLVREVLVEHVGATRVRCYRVQPDCETLLTISNGGRGSAAVGPSVRGGLLGHVATTGREFLAGDAAHGPLVDRLAAQCEDGWEWVWPVREHNATIGLIAVGNLRDRTVLTSEMRQTIGQLLALCWQHVASLERLQVVRRTDQASGVLTRLDFFALGERLLRDSYATNEPVVVAVLALEGLRRLDDAHCWSERDELIERLGEVVMQRTRSDDLVGRFADDRFIVLLRRLDSGLGRLIAEKMLRAANDCVQQLASLQGRVRLRMGLAGSGFAQPTLTDLLAAAFDAVDRARQADLPIGTDLVAPGPPARRADPAEPRTGGPA